MNTIIAVPGVQNSGNTSSIRRVFELLRHAYPEATYERHPRGGDTRIIVTISGVKIGIESRCDPGTGLDSKLKDLVEARCKIIICATRSYGRTVDAVNFYRNNCAIEWILKRKAPTSGEWESANGETAAEIFRLVQAAMDV
jgi:hypothetical protein